ncbi:MAG: hypothetical protein IJ023_07880 [Bacteroidales bacterium]|nr:hypothetical protein [Bacteroidales bacterium]
MDRRKKIMTAVTVGVFVAVVICAVCIAANRLGVVDGYDFGAGAYYYADIPGYENLINEDSYKASVPVWVHIVLFLAWGWLMYRLWSWIDRK